MNGASDKDERSFARNNSPDLSGQGRTIPLVEDRLDSRDLFVGTREIMISHGSDMYRLRLTAQNKLILTK